MTTNRFSASDEGKLFYIIGDFPVAMFEFDGMASADILSYRGLVNINSSETALLYIGSRVPQPINGRVATFYVFLYDEKVVGLPTHLYDESSNPIIFVELGKDPVRSNARYGDNLPLAPIAITVAKSALLKLAQVDKDSEAQEEKSGFVKTLREMFLDFFRA
jgi:hypothetical protein